MLFQTIMSRHHRKNYRPSVPNLVVHFDIDKNVLPVVIPYIRVPVSLQAEVCARLKQMKRDGIICKPQRIPRWISPMEVVMKGTNDFRIVIDLRQPNKAIRRDHYPLPDVTKFRSALYGAKCFSKLDLKSAYHHVLLDEESRELTTFMTSEGPMQFTRLPFGVNTAPEIFQRVMDSLLQEYDGKIIYIDDILVYAKNTQELKERVCKIKSILEANNLTLNKEKCEYEKTKIEFVGHQISEAGVTASNDKIKEIQSFRQPNSVHELRSFLGLMQFLSPHIKDFNGVVEPLQKILRKDQKIADWAEEQQTAFTRAKEIVRNLPTLNFFDVNAKTYLWVDASPTGVGAVLTQEGPDSIHRVIEYASKSLTPTERRYPQVQREALALVWGVEKFLLLPSWKKIHDFLRSSGARIHL